MATKVLNTKYQIAMTVKNNGASYIWFYYTFDSKISMLTWIKRFENVQGSTNDYEITFSKIDYSYDDATNRITKISTVLTAEDL